MPTDRPDHGTDVQFGLSRLLRETFELRNDPIGQILQDLLEAARLHLGMDVAFISENQGGLRYFRYVDKPEGTDLCQVDAGDPIDESYCKYVVEGRLPEIISNAQELPAAQALRITKEWGIGAYLSTPIQLSDGTIYGMFCTFSFRADHTLNERDLALIRVFSDIVAKLIQEDVDRVRDKERKRARIEVLLESGEHIMAWQPIVEMQTGGIVGVEALARFPGGAGTLPGEWFAEALEVGLAEALEASAIQKGLTALGKVPASAYVTLNVSADAFLSGKIAHILEKQPLERVVLEITEHDIIEDYAELYDVLAPLREKGLRLAVDDAGAGYASLRHILRLRPDIIKLDMSLTRGIDSDPTKRSLAASLVQFSREINARLIAEGVETRAEFDALAKLGVHKAQGFFLHYPLSMDQLVALFDSSG